MSQDFYLTVILIPFLVNESQELAFNYILPLAKRGNNSIILLNFELKHFLKKFY